MKKLQNCQPSPLLNMSYSNHRMKVFCVSTTPFRSQSAALLAVGLFIVAMTSARSAPPPEMPDWLSGSARRTLDKSRSELVTSLNKIEKKGADYNATYAGQPDSAPGREMYAQLERDKQSYFADLTRFKKELLTAANAEIERLDKRVEMDLNAIRRLGFERRAEDFKEFEDLDKEARKKLQDQFAESMIDLLFTGALDADKAVVKSIGSMNTFSAQKLIGKMKAANIKNPLIWELVREIGATTDKPAMRDATLRLLKLVEREGDLLGNGIAIGNDPDNIEVQADAAITLLSWGLEGPLAGWLASETKLCIATIYTARITRANMRNVERLNAATDTQLLALKGLSKSVEGHTKALAEVKGFVAGLE
jgi:hypothetical protein